MSENPEQDPLPPKKVRSKASALPAPLARKDKGSFLSLEEKKANHIASEQRRRLAIRHEFDKLCRIVPELDLSHSRSEALVLQKSLEFLIRLTEENSALKQLASSYSIPIPVSSDPFSQNRNGFNG